MCIEDSIRNLKPPFEWDLYIWSAGKSISLYAVVHDDVTRVCVRTPNTTVESSLKVAPSDALASCRNLLRVTQEVNAHG